MRTARSSSHQQGVCLSACWDTPLGVGLETPLGVSLETPHPGCGPGDPPPWVWAWRIHPGVGLETPQVRPLNFPPWVWAWRLPQARLLNLPSGCRPGDPPSRPDPSSFPLGVGLETCKACWDTQPLETCCKACWDTTCKACWDTTPSLVNRMTDRHM